MMLPINSPSTSLQKSKNQPSPPPFRTIVDNILPPSLTKLYLTKGLQNPSPLVQHLMALTLIKSLTKFREVAQVMETISTALEEDIETGQWSNRLKAVRQEIWRRIPDYRGIVNFSQQSQSTAGPPLPAKGGEKGKTVERNSDTADLLGDSALRLMWLYSSCLPDSVAEVRFDLGKLLATFEDADSDMRGGFKRLRLLHVLRLLKTDPEFLVSNKPGEIVGKITFIRQR